MTKLLVALSLGLGCGLTLITMGIYNVETAKPATPKTRKTDIEIKNEATFYFTEQDNLIRVTDSDFGIVCYTRRDGQGDPSCIQIAMPNASRETD